MTMVTALQTGECRSGTRALASAALVGGSLANGLPPLVRYTAGRRRGRAPAHVVAYPCRSPASGPSWGGGPPEVCVGCELGNRVTVPGEVRSPVGGLRFGAPQVTAIDRVYCKSARGSATLVVLAAGQVGSKRVSGGSVCSSLSGQGAGVRVEHPTAERPNGLHARGQLRLRWDGRPSSPGAPMSVAS